MFNSKLNTNITTLGRIFIAYARSFTTGSYARLSLVVNGSAAATYPGGQADCLYSLP